MPDNVTTASFNFRATWTARRTFGDRPELEMATSRSPAAARRDKGSENTFS